MKLHELPIYVAHCKKLADRRLSLERALNYYGLWTHWITDWDAEELTPEIVDQLYQYDPEAIRRKTEWYCHFEPRRLKPAEISLAIKHLHILQLVAISQPPYALVLEDDVIFCDGFVKLFDRMFAEIPEDAGFIFLGDCCNLRIPNPVEGQYFYRKADPATKCTDSFIVSREAAQRLRKSMVPFNLAADFELNYQIREHGMVTYWVEPPLISQGSHTGAVASTIQ